jgi:hypothetical protein
MSMTKVIEIDGKQVAFKASAAIPRIYRVRYGRDIFKDLIKLDKELKENSVFSIYQVLPEIITLWGVNLETQSEAKKNGTPSTGR